MDVLEEIGCGDVDQPDARTDERERAGVRKTTRLRGCHVDDDTHAGLDELLRGDAVEIGVVDDRDVVRRQPLDEVLGAAVELRVAGELDETHRSLFDR